MAIDKHTTMRCLPTLLLGSALALCISSSANASFTVCNQMLDIANIAIGEGVDDAIETRGWWTVAPNRCADIIPDKLKTRYIYVYAIDVRGEILLEGSAKFCTLPRQFRIKGALDCWKRGYTTGRFQEVDTRDAQSWTLFLREQRSEAPK